MRRLALSLCLVFAATAQTYQVKGIVVDHLSSRPLNHVLVHLGSAAREGGSVSALTESDGRFFLTNVPPGKYRLTAQRRGETPQAFRADDSGFSSALAVGPGKPTDNLIFALRANSVISGSVIDDRGEWVNSAQIHLFRQIVENGELQTIQQGMQITNSAGQFRYGHLHPGTYFVAVVGRPWFATFAPPNQPKPEPAPDTDVSYPVTWYGNTTEGDAASPIALQEGSTSNIQIALHPVPNVHLKLPASLSQRAGVSFSVGGPGGVRVAFSGIVSFNSNVREMTGVPAGRYELTLSQFEKGEPRSGGSQIVDVSDGMTLSMPTPLQISVKGQVVFSGERPAKDLEVFMNGGPRRAMAAVAADGSFSFQPEQLGAGSFTIGLNTPELAIQSISAHGAKYQNGKLEIPGSGNVALSIVTIPTDRLSKIEGTASAPGATVLLIPQNVNETDLFRRDQSDTDGSFSLAAVRPGRYTLIAIEDGSQLLYKTASVIKPYLTNAISLVVPLQTTDPLKIPVQKRLSN